MKKIILLLIATLSFLCLIVAPAGAISLDFNPNPQTYMPGDPTVSVDLVISGLGLYGAPSLSTFDLDVEYDPTVLSLDQTDADSDFVIDSVVFGDQLDLFGLGGNIRGASSASGVLDIYETSLDLSSELDSFQMDTFTLATLTFDILSEVSTTLTISGPNDDLFFSLGDADGLPFTEEIALNSGTISPVPEPATLLLLGSGLVGLMGFHRKRRRA